MHTHTEILTRGRKGFTLIELIVVIVIIAVLAAIGAVAYNQFVSRAHENAILVSATHVRDAIEARAAQDDVTTDTEVAVTWPDDPAAGAGSAALKAAYGTSYSGTLTYYPAVAPAAGQVQVDSPGSTRSACITLTTTQSGVPTVTSGPCSLNLDSGGTGGNTTPATGYTTPPLWQDGYVYTFGVRFSVSSSQEAVGVTFYKPASDSGTFPVALWDSSGTELASATYTGTDPAGYYTVHFPAPVTLAPSVTYTAGYYNTTGTYATTDYYYETSHTDGAATYPAQAGVFTRGAPESYPVQAGLSLSDFHVYPALAAS